MGIEQGCFTINFQIKTDGQLAAQILHDQVMNRQAMLGSNQADLVESGFTIEGNGNGLDGDIDLGKLTANVFDNVASDGFHATDCKGTGYLNLNINKQDGASGPNAEL